MAASLSHSGGESPPPYDSVHDLQIAPTPSAPPLDAPQPAASGPTQEADRIVQERMAEINRREAELAKREALLLREERLAKREERLQKSLAKLNAPRNDKQQQIRSDIALHKALLKKDLQGVGRALKSHADPTAFYSNLYDEGKYNALSYAASIGFSEALELMLRDPSLDVNPKKVIYPLEVAAIKGHAECVRLLLAHPRIDPNYVPPVSGRTPHALYSAAWAGELECLNLLLEDKRIDVNNTSSYLDPRSNSTYGDYTPLFAACMKGHTSCVEALLKSRAIEVNKLSREHNKGKMAPLHIAAQNGHEHCVGLLLEDKRVKVNIKLGEIYSTLGYASALDYAVHGGHTQVAQLLLKHPRFTAKSQKALGIAVENGHLELVRFLLQVEGNNLNFVDMNGHSLLHKAIINSRLDCLDFLIATPGICIDICVYEDDLTPLYYAAGIGDLICMKKLCDAGADVNLPCGEEKWTPLHIAAKKRRANCVEALLQQGNIDVNPSTRRGKTPLDFADDPECERLIRLAGGKRSSGCVII